MASDSWRVLDRVVAYRVFAQRGSPSFAICCSRSRRRSTIGVTLADISHKEAKLHRSRAGPHWLATSHAVITRILMAIGGLPHHIRTVPVAQPPSGTIPCGPSFLQGWGRILRTFERQRSRASFRFPHWWSSRSVKAAPARRGIRRRACAISPKFERGADIVRRLNKPGVVGMGTARPGNLRTTGMANEKRRNSARSSRRDGNRVDGRRAATLSLQA